MRKYVLVMLLVLFLSFSTMVAAGSFDEFTNSQENILTQNIVEIQAVSASDFGGVAVLSVDFSEQVQEDYFYYETILADIGLEMETLIMELLIMNSVNNDIDESRGGYLHFASHYKQVFIFS